MVARRNDVTTLTWYSTGGGGFASGAVSCWWLSKRIVCCCHRLMPVWGRRIEIALPNGSRVIVDREVDGAGLEQVLAVLGRR